MGSGSRTPGGPLPDFYLGDKMPRTEEDKITQAPLKLQLGDVEYQVKPLRILKQREWRQKLQKELGPVVQSMQISKIGGRTFVAGLSTALENFPEKVCDLVFAYAPNLEEKKDTIMNEATEEQMAAAFSKIWDLVFQDFLAQLGLASELLKQTPPPSASVLN